MSTETITVQVDSRAAQVYNALPQEERQKFGVLLSLQVFEATETSDTLESLMRRISRNAQQRGLTPEILEELLNDDE